MQSIITIPSPCHQDWNAMTPKDQGRHCGSCAKTVVDFTTWLPQDILLHFKSNKNVCGRFTADQLNEPIPTQEDFVKQISYFNISTVKKMAAIFLFAFMIVGSSCTDNVDNIGKSLIAITTNTIDTVPVKKLLGDTIYLEQKKIIDTPKKLMGAPAIIHKPETVKKPTVKGQIDIVPQPMIMGEPAIVEQPTIVGDTIIQNNTEKLPVCKPIEIKETEFVMGKMIAPKIEKSNKK
jgi:hypothetical protein